MLTHLSWRRGSFLGTITAASHGTKGSVIYNPLRFTFRSLAHWRLS